MDEAQKQMLFAATRAGFMALGSILGTIGVIDASVAPKIVDSVMILLGALSFIVPFVWGQLRALHAERDAVKRDQKAVQAGAMEQKSGRLDDVTHPQFIGSDHAQEIIQTMKERIA